MVTARKARAFFVQRQAMRAWRLRLRLKAQAAWVEQKRLEDQRAWFDGTSRAEVMADSSVAGQACGKQGGQTFDQSIPGYDGQADGGFRP
jgi:hypothetical protein